MEAETTATGQLAVELQSAIGDANVFTERADCERYESGWRYGAGRARLVCRPATTDEVAAVVRIARRHGAPVHPIGANTGLVAASNPDASGDMVVVALERLNRRIEIDSAGGCVLVDGGVLLSQLNDALAPSGRFFPIDLGADPQVGGMVATNTGGSRLVRYGDVREHVLGIEVVLPDGEVFSDLKALRKNNTGLDAKQLFIGTSGSFGIVPAVVLKTVRRPKQTSGVLVRAANGDAVVALFEEVEARAGELISAFEAMSKGTVEAVLRHGSVDADPFDGDVPGYAVLIEASTTLGSETLDLDDVLGTALMDILETEAVPGIEDVIVGDVCDFWHIRHQISESLREEGDLLGLDIAVPRAAMARFTEAIRREVEPAGVRVCDFGHWGDGGSHLNLVLPNGTAKERKAELQGRVYDICVRDFGGSYSAEHCVGPHNQAAYDRYTPAYVKRMCQAIGGDERFGTVRL